MSTKSTALDGIWELVRAEFDGENAPELLAVTTELELEKGDYVVRFGGKIADRGVFEIGHKAAAKEMVLRGIEGPNAGRTIPCIYQLVGDRLRICYGLGGIVPTEFTTTGGQKRYLATYRRRRKREEGRRKK